MSLISFVPPENIRKPEVFWCFQWVSKEIIDMKWVNCHVNWFIKINVKVEVFFFLNTTISVIDQFWLISRHVTDWFWLISFSDNCSFFFITAFFAVKSTVIIILEIINKVFHFFKGLLFWARKYGRKRYDRKSWEPSRGSLIVKHVFFTSIWSDDMTRFSFLLKFPIFKCYLLYLYRARSL